VALFGASSMFAMDKDVARFAHNNQVLAEINKALAQEIMTESRTPWTPFTQAEANVLKQSTTDRLARVEAFDNNVATHQAQLAAGIASTTSTPSLDYLTSASAVVNHYNPKTSTHKVDQELSPAQMPLDCVTSASAVVSNRNTAKPAILMPSNPFADKYTLNPAPETNAYDALMAEIVNTVNPKARRVNFAEPLATYKVLSAETEDKVQPEISSVVNSQPVANTTQATIKTIVPAQAIVVPVTTVTPVTVVGYSLKEDQDTAVYTVVANADEGFSLTAATAVKNTLKQNNQ
jgi:hypothetical protein